MDYSNFDQRGYPTLPVREGHSEWAATYESVLQDEMDIRLLERGETVARGASGDGSPLRGPRTSTVSTSPQRC